MSESRVFVVQEPPPMRRGGAMVHKDLSSAQRYGRLVTILSSQDQPSLTPGPMLHKLSKALRDFDPSLDFVCFAGGDPMSLALALVALKDLNLRDVQVLRWDRERDTSGERMNGGYYVNISTPLRLF
jgi:hypothetical protein